MRCGRRRRRRGSRNGTAKPAVKTIHRLCWAAVARKGSTHAHPRDEALAAGAPWRLAIVGDGTNAPRSKPWRATMGLPIVSCFTGQVADPFAIMMQSARCGLRLGLRRPVQRHHRGAGLRHAGRIDQLSLRVRTNPARRPLCRLTPVGDATAMAAAIGVGARRNPHRTNAAKRAGCTIPLLAPPKEFLEIVAEPANRCQRGPMARLPWRARELSHAAATPQRCSVWSGLRDIRAQSRSRCATMAPLGQLHLRRRSGFRLHQRRRRTRRSMACAARSISPPEFSAPPTPIGA